MGSVLIWFLLGGVGLYTLSKLAGGGDDAMTVKRVYGDGRLDRYGAVARKEKFRDPLYLCWGSKDKSYGIGRADEVNRSGLGIALGYRYLDLSAPELSVGYEYLSGVPAEPKARVAAMRAKIEDFKRSAKPGSDSGGPILKGIYDKSADTLEKYANTVVSSYKQLAKGASEAAAFAEGIGVPVSAVTSEAKEMAGLTSKLGDVELLDQAIKKYGPVASTIAKGLSTSIDLAIGGGSANEKAAGVLDLIASAAIAIPGYGVFIAAAAAGVSAILKSFADEAKADCADTLNTLKDQIDRALSTGIPVPWHLQEAFDTRCDYDSGFHFSMWCDRSFNKITHDQVSALILTKLNLFFGHKQHVEEVCVDAFSSMTRHDLKDKRKENPDVEPVLVDLVEGGLMPGPRQVMMRWWTLAQMYMSHPRVKEVFDALGRDVAGGIIASDEQVMLVAAPYAVANGIPVDDFAEELYKRSSGWSALADSYTTLAAVSAEAYSDDPLGQVRGAFADFCYVKQGLPFNAWWLQWAELSDTAETIVGDWNKIRDERLKAAIAKAPSLAGKLLPL